MGIRNSCTYSTCFFSTLMVEMFDHCARTITSNGVWVSDIATFNLAEGKPSARIKILKPGNFPSSLRAKIKLLTYDWGSPKQICERLNVPDKFVLSPGEYKYVYEYHKKFSTLHTGEELEDHEFSRRLDDTEHVEFIAMF